MATNIMRNPAAQYPSISQFLFESKPMAIVWLGLRVAVGYTWLHAALEKIGDPGWMSTGMALKGFWTHAVKVPPPPARPPIAVDWYRDFIQFMLASEAYTWFAKFVVAGELLVGLALILGALVGFSAFMGGFMNWNYIMAGSAGTNGTLLVAAILLILARRVAGHIGADYWLLRWARLVAERIQTGLLHATTLWSRRPTALHPEQG